MSNYNLEISRNAINFDEEMYNGIIIKIDIVEGKFQFRSKPEYVIAKDGSNQVSAFQTNISGNRKEMIASFTIDAFGIFSGNVDIEFGFEGEKYGEFLAIDINTVILPYPQIITTISLPDADNNWLSTL